MFVVVAKFACHSDLFFSKFLSALKALASPDPEQFFDTLENILKMQADNS